MSELEDPTSRHLVDRLSALGHQPLDPEVAARHTAMLASLEPMAVARRRARPVLAGALMAGALIGGGGMAAAFTGTLPDAAQDTARAALSKVGLKVPKGEEASDGRATDAAERDPAGTTGSAGSAGGVGKDDPKAGAMQEGPAAAKGVERISCGAFNGNHGQYVVARPDDPATSDRNEREEAARSDCGKPAAATPGDAGDPARPDPGRKPEQPGRPAGPGKADDVGRPDGAGPPDASGQRAAGQAAARQE